MLFGNGLNPAAYSALCHAYALITDPRALRQLAGRWARYPFSYLITRIVEETPTTTVTSLFPNIALDLPLGCLERYDYNVRLDEQIYLGGVVQGLAARRIFEIGTFDGATARYLAQVGGPETHVWTIDLPPEAFTEAGLKGWFGPQDVGRAYRGTPEESRITQLRGDSMTYDYRPYWETMDLVFVDAAHDYKHGYADSCTAIRLTRPGGCVVWHDYSPSWGRLVLGIRDATRGRRLQRLNGTTLALVRVLPPP